MQHDDVRGRILACLRFIADRCDGAYRADGAGFSKYDTEFGKSLAAQYQISFDQLESAAKLCRKYRRQLSEGGLQPPSEEEVRLCLQQNGMTPRSGWRKAPAPMSFKQRQAAAQQQLLNQINTQKAREQQQAEQLIVYDLRYGRHREMDYLYNSRYTQVMAETSSSGDQESDYGDRGAERLTPEPEKRPHWLGRHLLALALGAATFLLFLHWHWNIWLTLLLAFLCFLVLKLAL